MRKELFFLIGLMVFSSAFAYNATAYLFYGNGCPHCAEEIEFFNSININGFTLEKFEVWYNETNSLMFNEFANAYDTFGGGSVPRLFIGDKVFVGFMSDNGILLYAPNYKAFAGYKNIITDEINNCINNNCPDPYEVVYGSVSPSIINGTNIDIETSELTEIELPFIGKINVVESSLFFLTVIIGLLDGLNPCAMWMLSFLLAFTISTRSRKKVFTVGGIFILVSGIVYFLFITAWLNVFLSTEVISFMRYVAGGFALFAGIINIKDFFAFQKGFSLTIPAKWQPRIKKRMKQLSVASGIGMIAGVIVLAFTINLVELLCTIGFPVIYLKILSQHGLPFIANYFYLILYVIMYMLDDTIIFLIAVFTLSRLNMNQKNVRVLKLFSGIMITILALILMINPSILMFG
ncbi:MAG: hypothetical protein WC307_04460 [Candidatus Nanoarchaeia archaeon]|jgi:glutaredoxin